VAAIEFRVRVGPDRTLTIPAEYADRIAADGTVRVILLDPDDEEDRTWGRLASEQLLGAYADEDAIYDDIELPRR